MPKSVKKYIIEDDVYEYNKTNIEKFLDTEMSKTEIIIIVVGCVVCLFLVGGVMWYCEKRKCDMLNIFSDMV